MRRPADRHVVARDIKGSAILRTQRPTAFDANQSEGSTVYTWHFRISRIESMDEREIA